MKKSEYNKLKIKIVYLLKSECQQSYYLSKQSYD